MKKPSSRAKSQRPTVPEQKQKGTVAGKGSGKVPARTASSTKRSKGPVATSHVTSLVAPCSRCEAAAVTLDIIPSGSRGPRHARQDAVTETGTYWILDRKPDGDCSLMVKTLRVFRIFGTLTASKLEALLKHFGNRNWTGALRVLAPRTIDVGYLPNYCGPCDDVYCNNHWTVDLEEVLPDLYTFGTCPNGHRRSLDHGDTDSAENSVKSAPSKLSLDDLVVAYFESSRFTHSAEELRSYASKRLAVLEDLFGFSLEAVETPSPIHARGGSRERSRMAPEDDRRHVRSIAKRCIELESHLHSPFPYYMEGGPGPLEEALVEAHSQRLGEARSELAVELRRTFAKAVEALQPGIAGKTFDPDLLFQKGLPRQAPDPDDFW